MKREDWDKSFYESQTKTDLTCRLFYLVNKPGLQVLDSINLFTSGTGVGIPFLIPYYQSKYILDYNT
jgi:hypothetical protein